MDRIRESTIAIIRVLYFYIFSSRLFARFFVVLPKSSVFLHMTRYNQMKVVEMQIFEFIHAKH